MTEKLTLDEHNKEMESRRKRFEETRYLAGVLCTKCKEQGNDVEMHIRNPGWVNASNPPTQWVDCPKCGHEGLKQHL